MQGGMHPRAAELITSLALVPHPEGGYFREIHRSLARVRPVDGRPERDAITTIYFLLTAGQVSRWHRVASDEVWHYHEGSPLELVTTDATFDRVTTRLLGPAGSGSAPVQVVAARVWQAARSTGPYTLVGCTVGPGFEFADFEMLESRPLDAAAATRRHPVTTPFM